MRAHANEPGGAMLLFTNTANAELELGGRGPCVCFFQGLDVNGIYGNCAEARIPRINSKVQ